MKNIESNFKESRIYTPNQKFVKSATVTDKILANLHDEYKNNPDLFWSNLAKQEISWIKEFTYVCVGNAPDFEWFREGILNIVNKGQYTNKTFYSIGLLMEPSGGERVRE